MAIEVKNLDYIYMKNTPFEKHALKNISFSIKKGEFIGVIGHTGSGKSTLIQHFNGLLKPSSGEIFIDQVNIKDSDLKKLRQKVGMVFQYPEHQLFEETVFKDIAYGPVNMKQSGEEIRKNIADCIKIVGLDESIYDKSPFELSGGQKRRVAIAGVLAMKPEILVLDEPTAGLDPNGRNEILNQIKTLHDKFKITVILVSHNMEDIARLCDRILVISNGKLAMLDKPAVIFKNIKELNSMHLTLPQITILTNMLRDKGLRLSDGILTVEQAKREILKLIKKHRNGV